VSLEKTGEMGREGRAKRGIKASNAWNSQREKGTQPSRNKSWRKKNELRPGLERKQSGLLISKKQLRADVREIRRKKKINEGEGNYPVKKHALQTRVARNSFGRRDKSSRKGESLQGGEGGKRR